MRPGASMRRIITERLEVRTMPDGTLPSGRGTPRATGALPEPRAATIDGPRSMHPLHTTWMRKAISRAAERTGCRDSLRSSLGSEINLRFSRPIPTPHPRSLATHPIPTPVLGWSSLSSKAWRSPPALRRRVDPRVAGQPEPPPRVMCSLEMFSVVFVQVCTNKRVLGLTRPPSLVQ